MDDKEIIQKVLDGDINAYAQVVHKYQQDLLRLAASLFGDPSQSQDIVQKVFIEAYKALPDFDIERDFLYWLKGIMRNKIKQELRTRSRYSDRLKRYQEEVSVMLLDNAGDGEYQDHVRSKLAECMAQLPEESRKAITLRFQEAYTYEEIAEAINRGVQATYQLLYRVRIQLRDCVQSKMCEST